MKNKPITSISKRRGTDFAAIIGFHIIVRLIVYSKTYFMYNPINNYMQYLDPFILRHNLLEGLRDLHVQPPLFNAFLGLVLKLFPDYPIIFSTLYFVMGLVISYLSYLVCMHLTKRRLVSVVTAFIITSFPPLIQADRWLFYPYPLALLLLCACFFISRIQKNTGMQIAFIAVCAMIVLTRSFFHLIIWFVPVMLLPLFAAKRSRSVVFVVCLLAWVLSGVPYFRNYAGYGMFTGSTFQGHNVAKMARYVGEKEIADMISRGKITPLARIAAFSTPEVYYDYFNRRPKGGSEAIDASYKLTGEVNWNNEIYAVASKEYQRNTLELIKEYPLKYLKAVVNEVYIFFGAEPYRFFGKEDTWLKLRKDSAIHFISDTGSLAGVPLLIFGMYAAAMSVFILRIGGDIRRDGAGEAIISRGCEIFMLFNLAYVLLTANLFELGEGCFMRIPIDPFLIIGAAVFAADYVPMYGWNTRLAGRSGGVSAKGSVFAGRIIIAGISLLLLGLCVWNTYVVFLFQERVLPGIVYNEDYSEIEACEQAVRVKPNDADAYFSLGVAYVKLERYNKAIKALKQAIRIEPGCAGAYYNLGVIYDGAGRWRKAVEAFKQAIQTKPDDAEAYCNLGMVYNELGNYDGAIEALKQAIHIKADYADAHYNLGKTYLIIGDSKPALGEYKILKGLGGDTANKLFKLIYR